MYETQAPEQLEQDAAREAQRTALQTLIARRLDEARKARLSSGIEDIWIEDEDAYNGVDDLSRPSRTKEFAPVRTTTGSQSTILLNITKPKTDTGVARVQEMLIPHDERPWEVGPTPVPELSDAAEGKDERQVTLADGTQASSADVAKAAMAKADASARLMSNQIDDWFVEGDTYGELRAVIRDAGRYGTGVLVGPTSVSKEDRKWSIQDGVAMTQVVSRTAPESKRVSFWDLFPDPSCGDDIHCGGYVFVRDYMTARKLRELAKSPGYDSETLAEVLAAGPQRKVRGDRERGAEQVGEVSSFDSDTYEVYYYYGDVPPETLISGGFVIVGFSDGKDPAAVAKQIDAAMQLATVPIVVTMVNDRIVRISMNPLEAGGFPVSVFCWEPVDGQIWGRGIPRKMRAAQVMLTAAVRRMMENGGMAAGPQVVTMNEAIRPWDGRYEITGRKGWHFTPTDEVKDVRQAFAVVSIESRQAELQAIIDFSLRMADELSNMPLLLQGIVGSAPDTLGGQEIAQTNATSPLKAIAKQFDDSLIVPTLKRYYAWAMQDPNVAEEAKGDHQCKARGASALVQRDRAGGFLAQMAPFVKDPAFKIDPEKWASELMRANHFNPSSIQYTDEEARQLEEQQAQQQPQDPRIQVAQINAQSAQEIAKNHDQVSLQKMRIDTDRDKAYIDAQTARTEVTHQAKMVELAQRERIAMLDYATQNKVTLDKIKADLAKTAMELRTQKELAGADGKGPQVTEPPTEPPGRAPEGEAYQK